MSAVNSTSFLDKLEFDCCGNENRFPFKETSGFFPLKTSCEMNFEKDNDNNK